MEKNKMTKTNVCFYFQVHQPFRLKNFQIFEVGKNTNYYDEEKNKNVLNKVASKCYIPMNKLLLELLDKYPKFKVSFSFSGTVLEQLEMYNPESFELFKELGRHKRVEILSETYYHSLAFLYSKTEFKKQVIMHDKLIQKLFHKKPSMFRNTELIYNNELADMIHKMDYKGIITEGADKILGWRSPNFVYKAKNTNIKVLLKNYRLSDDIAFRFSNHNWPEYPLTAPKFANWVEATKEPIINLFMDYETFGEHQWKDTGIFDFMKALPKELLNRKVGFTKPSEAIKQKAVAEIDVPYFISWADIERDLSAWLGNEIQQSAAKEIYKLEKKVLSTKDKNIIRDWRRLQTSDHFYYMCTKWFSDGDVHKYFNPYDNPYEGFIRFMNILQDINLRCDKILKEKNNVKNKTIKKGVVA